MGFPLSRRKHIGLGVALVIAVYAGLVYYLSTTKLHINITSKSVALVVVMVFVIIFLVLPVYSVIVTHEIRKRRRIERDLIQAKEEAERASKFKDRFLSTMSHELRTPLNAVLGFSDLLSDKRYGDLNERQQRYVSHINSGGRHLLKLIGDIPIFVAHDSADVWTNPEQFKLDQSGKPVVVAGVPPDYFSKTGQLWGNPLYNREHMIADGFKWWIKRVQATLHTIDILRIDHFRGFVACWEIPGGDTIPYNEMIGRIFDGLGRRRAAIALPPFLWVTVFRLTQNYFPGLKASMGPRMAQDMVFDQSSAVADFGWAPREFRPRFDVVS